MSLLTELFLYLFRFYKDFAPNGAGFATALRFQNGTLKLFPFKTASKTARHFRKRAEYR